MSVGKKQNTNSIIINNRQINTWTPERKLIPITIVSNLVKIIFNNDLSDEYEGGKTDKAKNVQSGNNWECKKHLSDPERWHHLMKDCCLQILCCWYV